MTETVAALLAARAADAGGGLRTAAGDASWTWADVVGEAAARAAVLGERGLAGRHVGVLLDNVPEFVFLLGAAALSGTVIVGVNPTRRGEELARDVRHTDCALVLTDAAHAPLLAGLATGADVRLVDGPAWEDEVARHRRAAVPATLPGPEALWALLFTSGSTGAPKAVRLSQGRAVRTIEPTAAAFGPADVLYCAMPLFHGNALLACLLPGLAAGATVVLRPGSRRRSFLADVRRHGCTYFNYVGRALAYVLAQPATPTDGDNPLVWCLGSEASPRDRREFRRRFGCFVTEGYSSSEGGVVIQPFRGMPPGRARAPGPGRDVVVLDPGTAEECPRARFGPGGALLNADEAVGEIVGRDGLAGFEGYYANLEADAERVPERLVLDRRPRLPGRGGHVLVRGAHGRLAAGGRRELRGRAGGGRPGTVPGCRSRGRLRRARPPHGRPGNGGAGAGRGRRVRPGCLRRASWPTSPTWARSGRRASCGWSAPCRSPPPARSTASRCGPSAGRPRTRCGGGPTGRRGYRRLTGDDAAALARAFAEAGRAGMLAQWGGP